MTNCKHNKLVLIPEPGNRLRCRHCHLTITADELGESYCPECFEINGVKQYDFKEVEPETRGSIKYRCEECGITIE